MGAAAGQVELGVEAEQWRLVGRPAQARDAQAGDVHAQGQGEVGRRRRGLGAGPGADGDVVHRQLARQQQALAGAHAEARPAQPAQLGRAAGPGQHEAAGAELAHQRALGRLDLHAGQVLHQPGAARWPVQQPGDEGRGQRDQQCQRDREGAKDAKGAPHKVIPTLK
ncbi:hypothetical protein LXT12_07255 [Pelomonas sp. P7]|uniref:Uncharacterized protein n=1 Tax=Pelomonas caseinilytica TaxID=2906763 RepID=A0ABS8XIJ6_9BURK|nr:hypothetical protein [Pelomonas sp. P7]